MIKEMEDKMTKLNGSEKQIVWAEDIRSEFYAKKSNDKQENMGLIRPSTYTKLINTICKMAPGNEEIAKQKIDTVLDGMTEASQWIDSRNVLKSPATEKDTMPQNEAMAIINQINKYA